MRLGHFSILIGDGGNPLPSGEKFSGIWFAAMSQNIAYTLSLFKLNREPTGADGSRSDSKN